MSEQGSVSKDIVGGLLASPLSFARTCWNVLVRPASFYAPIELGARPELQRALSFFVVAATGSIATNFFLLKNSGMSLDMPAEITGGSLFNQIMQNDLLYKGSIGVLALILCLLWYWFLRRKAVRDKITSVQFMHAVLFPAGAIQVANVILGAVMIAFIALAPVSLDVKSIADPATREMVGIMCKEPGSYMCRSMLISEQYPLYTVATMVVGLLVIVWLGYIVASVIKSKTGIIRRRTILALGLAVFSFSIVFGLAIGTYIGMQQAGG